MRYVDELIELLLNEDFNGVYELTKKTKLESTPQKYFPKIFEVMENHPYLDYGMPGPIVHFMELYYKNGYENELIYSLKRMPTEHTVWMANRILNDPTYSGREELIGILQDSLYREDVNEGLKDSIKKFLNYQERKQE